MFIMTELFLFQVKGNLAIFYWSVSGKGWINLLSNERGFIYCNCNPFQVYAMLIN